MKNEKAKGKEETKRQYILKRRGKENVSTYARKMIYVLVLVDDLEILS